MSELNIYQKIIEIRKSIDVFTKDSEGHKYSYVSGAQVLKKIKEKMDALGVILQPEIPNALTKENNGNNFLISGEMKYVWINAEKPDDRIEVPWYLYGQQNDPSKAFGSGLTYSERYFLLKYLNCPTDEDDPDAQQGAPKGNSKPSYNGGQQSNKASDKQMNLINNLIKDVAKKHSSTEAKVVGRMKENMKTAKDINTYTGQEASRAIKILQDAKEAPVKQKQEA